MRSRDSASVWVCFCSFVCARAHHTPETPLPLIFGVLSSRENRPLPQLLLSSQWGGWCGTTWAREWLVALSVRCTTKLTLLVGGRDVKALWKQPVPCGKDVGLNVYSMLRKWIWLTVSPNIPQLFLIWNWSFYHHRTTSWGLRWNTWSISISYN